MASTICGQVPFHLRETWDDSAEFWDFSGIIWVFSIILDHPFLYQVITIFIDIILKIQAVPLMNAFVTARKLSLPVVSHKWSLCFCSCTSIIRWWNSTPTVVFFWYYRIIINTYYEALYFNLGYNYSMNIKLDLLTSSAWI